MSGSLLNSFNWSNVVPFYFVPSSVSSRNYKFASNNLWEDFFQIYAWSQMLIFLCESFLVKHFKHVSWRKWHLPLWMWTKICFLQIKHTCMSSIFFVFSVLVYDQNDSQGYSADSEDSDTESAASPILTLWTEQLILSARTHVYLKLSEPIKQTKLQLG